MHHLFNHPKIRAYWNEEQSSLVYSVKDVVKLLSKPKNVKSFIKKIKTKGKNLGLSKKILLLEIEDENQGKKKKILVSNKIGILRIVQLFSTKKAEPYQQWLANIGAQYIDNMGIVNLSIESKCDENMQVNQPEIDSLAFSIEEISTKDSLLENRNENQNIEHIPVSKIIRKRCKRCPKAQGRFQNDKACSKTKCAKVNAQK